VLKGIPPIISPELIKIMMEMGHSDEIVFADANFPAASMAQRIVRCDGHSIPALLEAVLTLFPLDTYVKHAVSIMEVVPGDLVKTPIWERYAEIISAHLPMNATMEQVERFAFYERAKSAYAIVATGEGALYANIILKKGVISQ
jgi:L-fucose mutarotase